MIPVHMAQQLESEFKSVNLRIVAIPPPHKAGLWIVELEYQVWNSSLNSEWKWLHSNATTVDKSGTYTTIQAAIDTVGPEGVIIVEPGHYFEDIRITKPMKLLARGESSRTLIFGQLIVESSNVTVDGFQFHTLNSLKSPLEVKNTTFVSIQNCRFYGNKQFKFLSHSNHYPTSALRLQDSKNFYLINSLFKDFSVGLAIDNCTNCSIVGNSFTSCIAAVRTFPSDFVKFTRNYFVRNLVALESDSLEAVDRILDNNIFEKNSAIIKKDKLLSRTDLEVLIGRSIAPKSRLSRFETEDVAVSPEVFIYGTCDAECEQAPCFQSPNPCIYIRGELFEC